MNKLMNKVIAPDGKRFFYGIFNEGLIIRMDFNPMQHLKYFESTVTEVSGILFLDAIGNKGDEGYAVYKISERINLESMFEELEETFRRI